MASNRALSILIVVATVAFAIGISVEKSDTDVETANEATASEATHVEGTPPTEAAEGQAAETQTETAGESQSESGNETFLGVNVEATPFVVLAVVFSLALALAVWLRPDVLLLIVAVAMVAFAVLDVREIFHQLDESKEGVAVLAGFIALLHGASAALAIKLERSPEGLSTAELDLLPKLLLEQYRSAQVLI